MGQTASVRHYDAQYGQFTSRLYEEIRKAAFGRDIGQNGWLTAEEHDLLIDWLSLTPDARLLDIACGSGGPTIRVAEQTGCAVSGVDLHEAGIAAASAAAENIGLSGRASFLVSDAARPLPFEDDSFDALICVDAVNHMLDRPAVFREWARVLRPGGRVAFTDPIVVTGALTDEEMRIRASIGRFLFVPIGHDERLLAEAGFESIEVVDRTDNMALSAHKWWAARDARAAELRLVEDEETFEGQQNFLEVAARLASERRLSRLAYRAVKT